MAAPDAGDAPRMRFVVRATLAGLFGGAAAGLFEFLRCLPRAASFLPSGTAKLFLFLTALDGATGAAAGAAVGSLIALLWWTKDGARWWRAAFADGDERGARVGAYAVAALGAGVLLSVALRLLALDALTRFHHRLLLAALVAAAGAALILPAVALVFLVAPSLSPLLPVGPRVRFRFAAPATFEIGAWAIGLQVGTAAVAGLLLALQGRPRMPPRLQALNLSLWAPAIWLGSLVLAHAATRLWVRWRRRDAPPSPSGPWTALAVALGWIGLPAIAGAAAYWSTVRQLDGWPFETAAVAIAVAALGWRFMPFRVNRLGFAARATVTILALVVPALLTLRLGEIDRVRKAALSLSRVAPTLVARIQAAADLDGDGFSSLLGGGDCNDRDPGVHPGAFDRPDDGIDQNCNGHQATAPRSGPRRSAALPAAVPRRPNVLLITIDALRADHLGCYGYGRPTTPRLDALAAESVRFANAWSHAPSTRYSVPAILAGRYPSSVSVGLDGWPPNVLPENRLLAEVLHDRGFHTGALLPYYYFERRWGLDQGFDDYDVSLERLHSIGGDPSNTRGSSARELADLAIAWLSAPRDVPTFLWVHFYDTHFGFERHPDAPETRFGDDELALYDGEIRYTDIQVGRLLDALRAAGRWDDTIIVVTSDHGDGFGEHGLPPSQRHGYHLYRNETKVPLLVRVPGIAPRVVDEPVGHIDIVPTIVNAVGGKLGDEPQLQGESLIGLMLGEHEPEREVYQEVWYEGPTSRVALVTREWHLIENLVPDGTKELYRLVDDPDELTDRAGEQLPPEDALTRRLATWVDESALERGRMPPQLVPAGR